MLIPISITRLVMQFHNEPVRRYNVNTFLMNFVNFRINRLLSRRVFFGGVGGGGKGVLGLV
jgi:hypothetical protein